jgi:signal transduction histidine kinase
MIATNAKSTPTEAADLMQAYYESEKGFRVQQALIGCIIVLTCMPLGSLLDYYVYPDHLLKFLFFGRLLCDLAVAPMFMILLSRHAKEWSGLIGRVWPLMPAISISWMIFATEGSVSPYYAGLNLVLIVACQLMPYTLAEAGFVCGATFLLYILACVGHFEVTHARINVGTLFNNAYFISLTTLISMCSSYYTSKRRLTDFRLRRDLDERNRQLAELDRLKSEFFANISHELRTPLTLILAPTQQILANRGDLDAKLVSALDVVQQNALRLLKLITDLLEIVRLDQRPELNNRHNLNLTTFVRATFQSMQHLASQKGLNLRYIGTSDTIVVHADVAAIEKVMLNLLSNAIKFTPAGGRVSLDLRKNGDEALFEISDTGIGIPEADLPHIFERFRQADGSATRRFQGVGIGLALARELVQEHGGVLTAKSQVNQGSVFTVRLPLSAAKEVHKVAIQSNDTVAQMHQQADRLILSPDAPMDWDELASVVGSGTQNVLVVEDEPDLRKFVVSLLSPHYQVRQADNGQRGLEAVRAYRPDLLLIDLMLPELDGLTVCQRVKSDPELRTTKIILLTARVDEESKLTALRNGADDFLQKPFSNAELTARVTNLLNTANLEKELRSRNTELGDTLARLREAESQLVHSEKLNAVGRLSAGILHEINNPLNAALMAVQVAKINNRDQGIDECLNDLDVGLDRIRTVTTDLRTFAYPNQKNPRQLFPIGVAVTSALRLLSHELDGITVKRGRLDDILALASQNQVVHVLINLISNSIKALREPAAHAHPEIEIWAESRNQRVFVFVRDNGIGIPKELLNRVTEPFFTTRDVGQGMGLGLSICHSIVSSYGGTLRVESSVGEFTSVSFDLPSPASEVQA